MTVTRYHRLAGFDREGRQHRVSSLGDGLLYVYGKNGDVDMGQVLEDVLVRNTGVRDFHVSRTLRGAVGTTADRTKVPAGREVPILGPVNELLVYNASGGTVEWDLVGVGLDCPNSGNDASHPGDGSHHFRLTGTSSAVETITRKVIHPITVQGVHLFSKVPPTSAGAYDLMVKGNGNNLMAASYNLKGIVAATLTSPALTATTAHLDLDPGETLSIEATAAGVVTFGDYLVAVRYVLR